MASMQQTLQRVPTTGRTVEPLLKDTPEIVYMKKAYLGHSKVQRCSYTVQDTSLYRTLYQFLKVSTSENRIPHFPYKTTVPIELIKSTKQLSNTAPSLTEKHALRIPSLVEVQHDPHPFPRPVDLLHVIHRRDLLHRAVLRLLLECYNLSNTLLPVL